MATADTTLLLAWKRHADAEAFAELVRRHAAMVRGVCRRIVRDDGLADDLSQECFLTLARLAEPPTGSLAGFLHRVATNRAVSALRDSARHARAVERASAEAPVAPAADVLVLWRELESRVDAAIAALPEPQRTALVAHFLEGRSHRELARELGVGHRTVGHRIVTAVEALRARLRRDGIAVEGLALAGWLRELPTATPGTVVAGLGKAAVAGARLLGAAGTVTGGLAVTGTAKASTVAAAVGVAVVLGVAWLALRPNSPGLPQEETTRATNLSGAVGGPVAESASQPADVRGGIERVPAAIGGASAGRVSGRVQAVDGTPLAGARVLLVEIPPAAPGPLPIAVPLDPQRASGVACDAEGRFAVLRPDPERRSWLSAFHDGFAGGRAWLEPGPTEDVVLKLSPGRSLRGRVLAPDGSPVIGALVELAQCWTAVDHAELDSGVVQTDARGEFAIGVDPTAVACTLQVDSGALGRDCFVGVLTEVFAELRWQPRAAVRGRVAGMTRDRVGRVHVDVVGTLDDPPVPVMRTGLREQHRFTAAVAADGSYAVEGIQPGLRFEALLVEVGAGGARNRLSPDDLPRFGLVPGEVVERDFALVPPITVRGRVITARDGRPVAGARVEVERDGTALFDAMAQTDAEGCYATTLVAGSGTYRLRARPAACVGRATFAQVERNLDAGARVELDFRLPEPHVLRFRVVDARGVPADSIRTELSVKPTGDRADEPWSSFGNSCRLDETGRGSIELFGTAGRTVLVVGRFPHGPGASIDFGDLAGAARLEERTVVLPDSCELHGTVHDADGRAVAHTDLQVGARYHADGGSDAASVRTDGSGRFTTPAAFRAGAGARLVLALPDHRSGEAELPATAAGQAAEIGIVLVR